MNCQNHDFTLRCVKVIGFSKRPIKVSDGECRAGGAVFRFADITTMRTRNTVNTTVKLVLGTAESGSH